MSKLNNFPVKHKGKTYWVSRSMAVAVFLFYKDALGKYYVAAVKRGKGCPDYIGCWCCPCGYVDYNETILNAAYRELWEETGLYLNDSINLFGISDNTISSNNQNVTFRFTGLLPTIEHYYLDFPEFSSNECEKDEIEEIIWIPLSCVGNYVWAFEHDKILFEAFQHLNDNNNNLFVK